MSQLSPADILTSALAGLDDFALGKLARDIGVPAVLVRRAAHGAHGQPTRADYHLQLCAWLGVHPCTGEPTPPRRVRFDAALFALGFRLKRKLKGNSAAQAARAMKVSNATVSRIENRDPRSFETMLAACQYAGLDPTRYVFDVNDERETSDREAA